VRRVWTSPRARRWINAELSYLACGCSPVPPSDRTPAALRVPAARRLDPGIYHEKSGGIEIIDMRHGRQRERPIPDVTE